MSGKTGGSIGLSVLGEIKKTQEEAAARKAAGKSAKKGDAPTDPRYSADELERLFANTGVIVAKDGSVLLKPANTGARRGRAPRMLVAATPEAIDAMADGLKSLLADEERMAAKIESFKEWAAKQDAK